VAGFVDVWLRGIALLAGSLALGGYMRWFDLKHAFLMEVTHVPMGILGAFAGWARWREIRLPESAPMTGRVWSGCLIVAGLVLLCYSEG
jgi:copper resistance protein D